MRQVPYNCTVDQRAAFSRQPRLSKHKFLLPALTAWRRAFQRPSKPFQNAQDRQLREKETSHGSLLVDRQPQQIHSSQHLPTLPESPFMQAALSSKSTPFCSVLLAASRNGAGCRRAQPKGDQAEVPSVPVSHPVEREVTDFVDFTGRTDAVHSVNIVARVTGYLKKMPFREGAEVKVGDLLFEIDPAPYQAQYDQALSQVTYSQAQLDLAESTLKRFKDLKKETPGAVSDQAIDQYQAAVAEAKARVVANQKSLEVYKLNLNFTRVVSPINGQVSRYFLTLGNLVNQDQTLLTTVVSLDPMYVYFDMDERTLLQIRRATNQGLLKWNRREPLSEPALAVLGISARAFSPPPQLPVLMGLQGEDGFPHAGNIDFSNNQVNPGTGSLSVRGVFDNPKPPGGVRLLSPGMFVRIRLPIGQPHQALLVIDRAIQSDQGHKYLYVIDAENKAQSRRISTGALQEDGLRVVTAGLKKEDRVVVGAFLQVHPHGEVKIAETKMPSFDQAAGDDASGNIPNKPATPKKDGEASGSGPSKPGESKQE